MRRSTRATTVVTVLALAVLTVAPAAEAGRHGKPGKWDVSRIKKAPRSLRTAPAADGRRADLVVQLSGADAGALRVHPNNGATSANPWEPDSAATSPQWGFADLLLLVDVTGDDRTDVIARDRAADGGTLWIYPNDGSGSADPWPAGNRFAAGTGWNAVDRIMVGDVTGDGRPDLVARNPAVAGGTLLAYPNNGSVTSNPWTRSPIWSGTGWNLAQMMMLGDVTGDGHPDVVVRDGSGAIRVYPHNGSTSTNFWTSVTFGSTSGWTASDRLSMADVTGDGHPDLIARDVSGALWIHPWQSATEGAMWSAAERFAAGDGFGYAGELVTGDVDGDGRPELVAQVAPGDELWLLPNNGADTGNPWPSRVSAGSGWGFAAQVFLADVGGDGLPDLLALDRRTSNGTLWIYPNNGTGWTSRYFAGTGWNTLDYLMAGDVSGDGLADIVGRDDAGNLYAYPGNGSTTAFPWDPRVWVGSNWQTAGRLALGDIDRDGIADLVDLEKDGSLWVFPTGASTDPIRVPGDWAGTRSLNLGHVTGAQGPDLVVGDASGALSVYAYDGATPWSGTARSGGDGFQDAISLVLG